jgi:hypothetical protein
VENVYNFLQTAFNLILMSNSDCPKWKDAGRFVLHFFQENGRRDAART